MAAVAEILHPQDLFPRLLAFDIIDIGHFPSNHHPYEGILGDFANGFCIHIGAILEHGHAVADIHDFLQTMGNIDDTDAIFL